MPPNRIIRRPSYQTPLPKPETKKRKKKAEAPPVPSELALQFQRLTETLGQYPLSSSEAVEAFERLRRAQGLAPIAPHSHSQQPASPALPQTQSASSVTIPSISMLQQRAAASEHLTWTSNNLVHCCTILSLQHRPGRTEMIDITSMGDYHQQFVPGRQDPGTITISLAIRSNSAIRDLQRSMERTTPMNFTLTLGNSNISFEAFLINQTISVSTYSIEFEMQIVGPITAIHSPA